MIRNIIFIGGGNFISTKEIEIGDDVMFSWGCTVIDTNAHSLSAHDRVKDVLDWKRSLQENTIGKYKDWTKVRSSPIRVINKAWIGFNVIILKSVTIGECAVIGAGSVVTGDRPSYTVNAGNPAKLIRELPKQ